MELDNINGISYQLVTAENMTDVANMVANHFIKHEPLAQAIGFSYDELFKLMFLYCKVTALEQLSIIAIDVANQNSIVGFMINEDPKSKLAVDTDKFITFSKNFELLFKIMADLHQVSIDFAIEVGECFHMISGGILPKYQGRGIMQHLILQGEKLAKVRGFKYILVEATSPIMKHLLNSKLNYKIFGHVNYTEYVFYGEKLFQDNLANYNGPHLLIKYFV